MKSPIYGRAGGRSLRRIICVECLWHLSLFHNCQLHLFQSVNFQQHEINNALIISLLILTPSLSWEGIIIEILWPIELNDLWSKTICRPQMIIWSGATFILRWSCLHSIKAEMVNKKVTLLSSLSRAKHPMNPPLKRKKSIFSPSFALMAKNYLWSLFRWEPVVLSGWGLCKIKYLSKEVQRTLLIHKKF